MKTIAITAVALAASTSFAFAQAIQSLGEANTSRTGNTVSEGPGMRSGANATEIVGTSNREQAEPGDFAVTGGVSTGSSAGNPTGQVDPGTSNAPAGNSARE
jgi:hypothetical protein